MNVNIAGKPKVWTYEEICDLCREANHEIDDRRWLIGDHALLIDKKYGDHTLDDFSRDIGMNKSTVRGWRRVADFYPESVRRNILNAFPNLTYAYFKDALRLKYLDEAIQWLERCSSEGWSADQASHELSEQLGHETINNIPGLIENIFIRDGMCIIEVSIGMDDEQVIRQAKEVTIRTK